MNTQKPCAHLRFELFFSEVMAEHLHCHAVARRADFVDAGNGYGPKKRVNRNRRIALTLRYLGGLATEVRTRIRTLFLEALARLHLTPFPVSRIEVLMAAHPNGYRKPGLCR